jgi:hypothetical protein
MSLHNANLLFDFLIAHGFLLCMHCANVEGRIRPHILAGSSDQSAFQSAQFCLVHCASIKEENALLFTECSRTCS